MKLEELCAAVQEARYYNERFTRREYTSAFRTYTERFGPLYMEAVRRRTLTAAGYWRSSCWTCWRQGGNASAPGTGPWSRPGKSRCW